MAPDPATEFEELAQQLAGAGASSAKLFGQPSLTINGKGFACLMHDYVAFRLGAANAEHGFALSLPGAALFDPSGQHRPFKDWVAVPVSHAEHWAELGVAAIANTLAVTSK